MPAATTPTGSDVEPSSKTGGAVPGPVRFHRSDRSFPASLRTIPNPPHSLTACGTLELLQRPAVAIVGSRDHTRYGAEVCRTVAAAAASRGLVIVSGMARGLDAVAHTAALDAGGATIGVVACGIDVVYPKSNRPLYQRIRDGDQGLLLTELPDGERPNKGSFVRRNRLISGLAPVLVIVEASGKSGTLLTAELALRQGREVLAVPGPITSANSVGTNRLIRDGAAPLLEVNDLLRHYPGLEAARGQEEEDWSADRSPQGRILSRLALGSAHVDDLAAALGMPVGQLLGLLGAMEIMGQVRQEPGLVFCPATPVLSPTGS